MDLLCHRFYGAYGETPDSRINAFSYPHSAIPFRRKTTLSHDESPAFNTKRDPFLTPTLTSIAALLTTVALACAAQLPQDHEYQRVLRNYLGQLEVKDFDHGITNPTPFTVVMSDAPEKAYRDSMLVREDQLPIIGSKRGAPCVTAPPEAFLLSVIEQDDAVRTPPGWPEPIAWLVRWDNAGNPFNGSRAMKLRAFAEMSVEMIMTDHLFETKPENGMNRSDWFGKHLMMFAYPYADIRDVLPRNVRKAYETGLRKMTRRQLDWEVKGEEVCMDMVGIVGLWYAGEALDDRSLAEEIENYIHRIAADTNAFHPAGYFVDHGGLDMSFNGMAAFCVNWVALAGGWDFLEDAIARYYRLRAHLVMPEPGGGYRGPSHFNARLDSDAWDDQWKWGYRDYAGAMLTDEAVYLTEFPSREDMESRLGKAVSWFNTGVSQTPRRRDENGKLHHLNPEEIRGPVWAYRIWPSHNYAISVCYAYDHYRNGTYARLKKLREADSPWLRSPFERDETFIRAFDDAFTVARMDGFAAIIHSGPVGSDSPDSGNFHHAGPYGFGGGQLSAFWTPEAGSILLSRRGGMSFDENFDKLELWKQWPIHAVTGCNTDGKVFTSARIVRPDVETRVSEKRATVRVSGRIPSEMLGQGKALQGRIAYERAFEITPDGVAITTSARAYGQDRIAELYETLPVFYSPPAKTKNATLPVAIEFKSDGKWSLATSEFGNAVAAVRVTRFGGAIEIAFDRPRRAALSTNEWTRGFITRDVSRNVMVDLLDNGGQSEILNSVKTVSYSIKPIAKP